MKISAKRIAVVVLILVVIICVRLWINAEKAMIAAPDALFFSVEGAQHDYDMYYLSEAISFDPDIFPKNQNWDEDALHLFIDAEYLNNEWNYVYVSGSYWYSPFKPTVTVNGYEIPKIKTDNGKTKTYHFYLYGVKEDEQYNIAVRCGDDREMVKVVFHAE